MDVDNRLMSWIRRAAVLALAMGCDPSTDQPVVDSGSTSEADQGRNAVDMAYAGDAGVAVSPCQDTLWTVSASKVSLSCGVGELLLTPRVHLMGQWAEPIRCDAASDTELSCLYASGELVLRWTDGLLNSVFTASEALRFGGIQYVGEAELPEANGWLSNGFQSWSQSGVIQIPQSVGNAERSAAFAARSDAEVIRNGTANSWWHTFVNGRPSLVAGVTSAETFRSWIGITGRSPELDILLTNGGTGESMALEMGDSVHGEQWFLTLTDDINQALVAYASHLPRRMNRVARPEAGWNSWYELWDTVDEDAIRANAALAKEHLTGLVSEDHLPLRIVIDDGWQKGWGDWTANEKFPSGLSTLASELKQDGFEVGIWLAPLLVHEDVPLASERPEWFVQNTIFNHLVNGPMKILDVTHPDAAAHLSDVIRSVVDHGYDLLKIDFLFAGTFEGDRQESITGFQAYNRALDIIREAAGPETILLSVGSPPIAGFDVVDAWRVGPDVAVGNFDASWFFIPNVARTIAARWPYCLHMLCDGDPPILRSMTDNEVQAGAWAAAFAGGAFFLSDDLRDLDNARYDWLDELMAEVALGGIPAMPDPMPMEVPESLTSALSDQLSQQSRHQVPNRWRLSNGDTVYVNWSDRDISRDGRTYPPRTAEWSRDDTPTTP